MTPADFPACCFLAKDVVFFVVAGFGERGNIPRASVSGCNQICPSAFQTLAANAKNLTTPIPERDAQSSPCIDAPRRNCSRRDRHLLALSWWRPHATPKSPIQARHRFTCQKDPPTLRTERFWPENLFQAHQLSTSALSATYFGSFRANPPSHWRRARQTRT